MQKSIVETLHPDVTRLRLEVLRGLLVEVSQNSIKHGCNTSLKGVGKLPHKTDLKLYFELGLNRLSVVRDF